VIILDTSGLVAAYGRDQVHGQQVRETLTGDAGPLVLSPFVLAELDYLITSRLGVGAELNVLEDVAGGVYRLAEFTQDDVTPTPPSSCSPPGIRPPGSSRSTCGTSVP
jgi:uncharacterized protein